jgi:hypothetical protein
VLPAPPVESREKAAVGTSVDGSDVAVLENVAALENVELRQRRERHRFMLGLALFIVAASFFLQFNDGQSVRLPWLDVALPPLCGSRALFNVECPGCGLTRSFIALAAGDWHTSFHYHRLGWLMALAVVMQIPYRVVALRELRLGHFAERTWPTWFGNALIVALIANWLVKMIGGH